MTKPCLFNEKDLLKSIKKEKSIETIDILKRLQKKYPTCYALPKPVRPSSRGVPDRIFCINGRFAAIEVKREKMFKITPKQLEHQEKIRKAGGISIIAHSWEEVEKELDECL